MALNEFKEKIGFALKAVEDVPELFKVKAFEVILLNILKTPMTPLIREENSIENMEVTTKDSNVGGLQKLSSVTKLNDGQLGDVYDFGEKEPDIVTKLCGSEADKQIHGTMLLLLAMKYYYGQEWVRASLVSNKLQDYGIGALKHLAENLDKHQSEFLSKGKTKGTEYKLSINGEQIALDFIKGLFV